MSSGWVLLKLAANGSGIMVTH